jgi:hypothetical protein
MTFEAILSRPKMALFCLGSLLGVVLGLWMVGAFGEPPSSRRYPGWEVTLVDWAGMVFAGIAAAVCARRLLQSGAEVRIDTAGIYWRRWGATVIPWSAINRIGVGVMRRQRFLCLYLTDPAALPAKGIPARLAPMNRSMGYGDIAVSTVGTDGRFEDMVAAVERFAPGLLQ